jgi:hypothetical protein
MTGEERREIQEQEEGYEPPRVEEIPAKDGPAVTAAGKTPPPDEPLAAEWRPTSDEREQPEDYETPRVEDLPAEDGPAVTSAGRTPPTDDSGPEWRPAAPRGEGSERPAAGA